MGLDMYLYLKKQKYQYWSEYSSAETPKVEYPPIIEKACKVSDSRSIISSEMYQVGYWRKANAIHNWFVTHCADGEDICQEIRVTPDKLKDLQVACMKVLADHDLAEDVLPSCEGFFFGDTNYDEWYFNSVEYTRDLVTKILIALDALEKEEPGSDYEVAYQASW